VAHDGINAARPLFGLAGNAISRFATGSVDISLLAHSTHADNPAQTVEGGVKIANDLVPSGDDDYLLGPEGESRDTVAQSPSTFTSSPFSVTALVLMRK
jgi:hypothetical protein